MVVRTQQWAKQHPSWRSHTGSWLRTLDWMGTRVSSPGCSDRSGVGCEQPGSRKDRGSSPGRYHQSPSEATSHTSDCHCQAATEAATCLFHALGEGCTLSSLIVVQLLSCVWLFAAPWTAARQASLSFTSSWSLLKLMSIMSMMPSNHLCHPLLLPPSIFPSIKGFSNESALLIRWPKFQLHHQFFQ